MTYRGCGGSGHSWRECSTPRQGNNLPLRPNPTSPNQGNHGLGYWVEQMRLMLKLMG